jgi:transcriptional regulator with XRE-family HTH domain
MNRTQCKMARAALGWRAADLADASGIHRVTVARFERGDTVDVETVATLRAALEKAGASFPRRSGRVGVMVPE